MTAKSFIAGLFISLIAGIPIAFIHDLIGTLVGVILGSFIASSKKGGGAVGLLTAGPIYLCPYALPLFINYLSGSMDLVSLALLIGYMLINIFVIAVVIGSMLLGILFGWIGLRLKGED